MSQADATVTRFAPSPTGFLHIGGARTALFNWLYARHCGGKFLLRIEDTDRKRSTQEAIDAIIEGLGWLGLDWDGEAVFQSQRAERHREVALSLLESGGAYRCYCTAEELEEMRAKAKAEGRPMLYDGRWRDRDPAEAPAGVEPAIRLKAPQDGETVIDDNVQGRVTVSNKQLDDMILLRSDGTPTYMLSVVVDDHDMGVTHVVRGDDHLTNAFRQTLLFKALGWRLPTFAHIPLIHGPDGSKLSKRHGALGIEAYREMGYLPEALRNYLLRLGWSHGDEEIISTEQAIAWFGLEAIGRSPARLDLEKLDSLNAHYLREADPDRLVALLEERMEERFGRSFDNAEKDLLHRAMPGLTPRAKTLNDLSEAAAFYIAERPLAISEKGRKLLDADALTRLGALSQDLATLSDWSEESLDAALRSFAEREDLKLGKVAQPLRAALTGSTASPGIFEVMALLGRDESLARLQDVTESTE